MLMTLFACVPASIAAKVKKCLYQENDTKVIKIKRRAGLFSQHRHCLQLNKDTAAQIANLNGPHYRLRKTPIAFIERRRMSHCPPFGSRHVEYADPRALRQKHSELARQDSNYDARHPTRIYTLLPALLMGVITPPSFFQRASFANCEA